MTFHPILAVHISDGVLTGPWQVGGLVLLVAALAIALYRIPQDLIPRLGVVTAIFFVVSQQHLPLGPLSVHLLLNSFLGILLGGRCVIAIAIGLCLQAFLAYHGGQLALGVNFAVLTIPALIAGFVFRVMPKRWLFISTFLIGSATAFATVVLNVTVLYFGTQGDWSTVVKASLVMHIPIIVLEGFITAFAVNVLRTARPEWLGMPEGRHASGNTSANGTSH